MIIVFLIIVFFFSNISLSEQSALYGINLINKNNAKKLHSKKWALLTNQTGYSTCGKRSLDYLLSHGIQISYVLVPEHGFEGTSKAEKSVNHLIDKKTGIPLISLHTGTTGVECESKCFQAIDGIIIDLQDAGIRHYTYISTLLMILKQAAMYKKIVLICDRPNPLGSLMHGPLVDQALISFISCAPIPLRHGMTIGEIAHYFNFNILESPAPLIIIPMRRYKRDQQFTAKSFPMLSPNIKTLQACFGYSFLGLLGEIRPFEVGVGTNCSFQYLMLPTTLIIKKPYLQELQNLFMSFGIESTPHYYYNAAKKKFFDGVQLYITSIDTLSTISLLISLIDFFKKREIKLIFSPSFDKCIGTAVFREWAEEKIRYEKVIEIINCQTKEFFLKARNSFLYWPYPSPFYINK